MIPLQHLMITCYGRMFDRVTPPRNRIGKYPLGSVFYLKIVILEHKLSYS